MKYLIILSLTAIVVLSCTRGIDKIPEYSSQPIPNEEVTTPSFSKLYEAEKIEVISYATGWYWGVDSATFIQDGKLAHLPEENIKERFTLTKEQAIRLRYLVHDYPCKPTGFVSFCYIPHHAILFYSKDDEIIEAIELCITCSILRPTYTSKKMDKCDEKLEAITSLFYEVGIRFYTEPWLEFPFPEAAHLYEDID